MPSYNFGASWALTTRCNYKCTYCYRYKEDKIVDFYQAKKIIDHLYSMGCRKLSLAGGEPLLWDSKESLFKLISYIKKKGITTELITNGYYLEEVDLIRLSCTLDVLTIDIDCLDNNIQYKLGRGTDHFSKSDKLFRFAQNMGIKTKTNTVVTAINKDEIVGLQSYIEKNEFYKWKIYQFLPIIDFSAHRNDLVVSNSDFEQISRDVREKMQCSTTKLVIENNQQMSSSYINISPSGKMHTNEALGNGLIKKHELGNILDLSLSKIVDNTFFDEELFLKYHQII